MPVKYSGSTTPTTPPQCPHLHPLKHHSIQYPTISCIAKDYLAIQGFAVASERTFSSGGHISATGQAALYTPQNDSLIDVE
ncbi:hypothetical protein AZE42_13481 [Rhizopogon vesiculosus]|uniref:HAT C-terminal dimerisation domain-containing protein n=1 Tax=Rhizopogon vesiculosus TaxID=180088 RepID=A0A1J8Q016_9AGAM|nr:hypothetical protein AZE42_13481 [Rhizopogon vesiculosus]